MLYSPARIDDENDLKCCSTDHKEGQMGKKKWEKVDFYNFNKIKISWLLKLGFFFFFFLEQITYSVTSRESSRSTIDLIILR